jgi:integrase
MPYRAKDRDAWKVRVRHPDGRSIVAGADTARRETAVTMERWASQLYADRTPQTLGVLDAIVRKLISLPLAYDARHDLPGLLARLDDVDIEPFVSRWAAALRKSRKGSASADRYERQVRTLVTPRARFPRSRFTRKIVDTHLRGLDVEDPTRNRHKAAFSSFAKYLVREDVLDRNPVLDIEGWSEGEGRLVHYEREDAQRLIAALPQPFQAIEALMVGAGLEWQAVERLRVRDVDVKATTAFANGGKTRWRQRLCRIVEAWTVGAIRPALTGKLPDALVFEGVREWTALAAHKAAVKALELSPSTLHDWRHTHAVLMLRAGYKPTVVAHQLGHRDTSLVWKRYGRFVVDDRDYALPALPQELPNERTGAK